VITGSAGLDGYLLRLSRRAPTPDGLARPERPDGLDPWPVEVLASVIRAVAERCGCPEALDGTIFAGSSADPDTAALPDEVCTPDLLGPAHQALLDRGHRRRRGVFYTPPAIAGRLVEATTTGWDPPPRPRVCDPACGGGVFLLAAGRWLESLGIERTIIATELLWGIEVDPVSAAVSTVALALWAGQPDSPARPTIAVADSLQVGIDAWPGPTEPFDMIVGNPPFLNQLHRRTARDRSTADTLVRRFGVAAKGYADASTLFLLASLEMASPGARVGLVMPQSFLATRDARQARASVVKDGALVGLWLPRTKIFDASVRVCVPVIETRRGEQASERPVALWAGPDLEPVTAHAPAPGPESRTWAPVAAPASGAPVVDLDPGSATLASLAGATAGFRDQFYGIVPYVFEGVVAGARAPGTTARPTALLVTSGMIEPGRLSPEQRPVRFARQRFERPVVDLHALREADPTLARWGAARLRPKVVVATQTRVLEAAVDETGDWWPSVPVIAVEADSGRLWEVAAVLNSPVATAWAYTRYGGTALSVDAVKLSARQVLDIPLPAGTGAWEEAAGLLRRTAGVDDRRDWTDRMSLFGSLMCQAYGVGAEVLEWWVPRLPGAEPA
jgi:hypothetical protein